MSPVTQKSKTFEEIYSRKQIRKLSEISNTCDRFDWHYSPIVFCFPYGFFTIYCCGVDEQFIHIKAKYMFEVWEQALSETKNKYPGFLEHSWIKNGYYRFIHYTDKDFAKAKQFFWERLKDIADSQTVVVYEKKTVDENNKLTLICKSYGSFASRGTHSSEKARAYKCSDIGFTYPWNEISDFFIELSEEEVSFMHGDEMNEYDPSSQPLLDACLNQDFDAVKAAVERGIDVNCFDKSGYTPLACLIEKEFLEFCDGKSEEPKEPEYTDNIVRIFDYLIEHGANIDLYGYGSDDLLTLTYTTRNLRVMEHLLQRGINKYSNCFITDLGDLSQWHVMNAACAFVCNDICRGLESDSDKEKLPAMEDLLEKYGITYNIEEYDSEECRSHYKSLPDPYS